MPKTTDQTDNADLWRWVYKRLVDYQILSNSHTSVGNSEIVETEENSRIIDFHCGFSLKVLTMRLLFHKWHSKINKGKIQFYSIHFVIILCIKFTVFFLLKWASLYLNSNHLLKDKCIWAGMPLIPVRQCDKSKGNSPLLWIWPAAPSTCNTAYM